MKPTLEQIQAFRSKNWPAKYLDGDINKPFRTIPFDYWDRVIEPALELAEQVALGEAVVLARKPNKATFSDQVTIETFTYDIKQNRYISDKRMIVKYEFEVIA